MNSDEVADGAEYLQCRVTADMIKSYCGRGVTESTWEFATRILRPLQRHFLLLQQIFFILVCIHGGSPRVPRRVLASGPKPCGGNSSKIERVKYLV